MLASLALGGAPAAPDTAALGYYAQPALHGDTLVFQSGGDLWTTRVPAAGERAFAQRLTSAPGIESRPTISPDGRTVAFAGTFDGNLEVFTMPIAGGTPTRLTFHPGRDIPLGWTPDGKKVLMRSDRAHPHGDPEMFLVPAQAEPGAKAGPVEPLPFGEGSLGSFDPRTGALAFNPRSNEHWHWKGYRGGTAPDIWTVDRELGTYARVTQTDSNELYPMWIGDRIWFLGDDDGRFNLRSCKPDGSDRMQHTQAGPNDFDLRSASADASGAPRVVFTQGADVWLFDAGAGASTGVGAGAGAGAGAARKLDIALQGDRLESRWRVEPVGPTITQLALSADAKRIALVSRGEVVVGPVGEPEVGVPQAWLQAQGMSASREGGVSSTAAGDLLLLSDKGGEASIVELSAASLQTGASDAAKALYKSDRWIFTPVSSPDGSLVAFGDKSMRMNVMDAKTGAVRVAGTSVAGEVVDYRFSPDGRWLAWVAQVPSGLGEIHIYDTQSSTDRTVSTGMSDDRFPRWDPRGVYLYFASARAINPMLDQHDLAFITRDAWQFFAVPLQASAPPPIKSEAARAGVDLSEWAKPKEPEVAKSDDGKPDAERAKVSTAPTVAIDFDDFMSRAALLPAEAGTFRDVSAIYGGLVYLRVPGQGVADEEWPVPVLGAAGATLERLDLAKGKASPIVDYAVNYASVSADCSALALATTTPSAAAKAGDGAGGAAGNPGDPPSPTVVVVPLGEGAEPTPVAVARLTMNVDIAAEWAQVFDEAWRLQRDFFWKPDMGGVDWPAVRARYGALLSRVGTRQELNDLVGEMCGELGTSHAYISGGDAYESSPRATVGTLGIDVTPTDRGFRIDAILPDASASGGPASPLAAAHRGVKVGDTIVSIDGRTAAGASELGELLVGRTGKLVALGIAGQSGAPRIVEVEALATDEPLRYAAWVEGNRRAVAKASDGRLGYMHLPDMDSAGLIAFVRAFYPQLGKDGLVIDERWNGGGYVSQMVLERLRRRAIARDVPREGAPGTYPARAASGPMVMLVNERSGSDGDIFPNGFRLYGLGPIIGTRTWGGVVGIRSDKPFVDGGAATQPEFAWWDPIAGFTIEGKGVQPDIVVDRTPADIAARRDPQLDRAIAEMLPKLGTTAPPKPPVPGKGNTSTPPAAR